LEFVFGQLLGESELKEQMLVECREQLEAARQELNAATQARRTSTQRIEQVCTNIHQCRITTTRP
jgi:hypothetical protein